MCPNQNYNYYPQQPINQYMRQPQMLQQPIALNGETIPATTMIVTPAAVENFFNVHADTFIEVPRGCCVSVSVENTSTIAINVQNANLTAIRTA